MSTHQYLRRVMELLILGTVWGAAPAYADNADFTATHRDFFALLRPDHADITLGALYEPEHEEENGAGSFSLKRFSGAGELLAPLGKELFLRGGLEYGASMYDFDRVEGARAAVREETLHRAVASGGMGIFLTHNLLLTGVATIGMYSDFEDGLDFDHSALYGNGMLIYRINPGAQLLVGAERSEVFDDTPLFPLLGIRLLSEDGSLHVSLTLPLEARVGWRLTTQSELYLRGKVDGDRYHIDVNGEEVDVAIHDQRVGLGAQLWFGEHVGLTLEGGLAVGSEFELKTVDAGQFRGDLKEAGYISVELGFAL